MRQIRCKPRHSNNRIAHCRDRHDRTVQCAVARMNIADRRVRRACVGDHAANGFTIDRRHKYQICTPSDAALAVEKVICRRGQ